MGEMVQKVSKDSHQHTEGEEVAAVLGVMALEGVIIQESAMLLRQVEEGVVLLLEQMEER